MSATWDHDTLAHDLAEHLATDKRLVWEDLIAGSAGSCRPDVFTLQRSFANPDPTSFEIKISRADLLADLTAGKWRNYSKFSAAVYFAVPDGLAKVTEFPAGVGVYVRGENGWTSRRRAIRNNYKLDTEFMLKLLIDGLDVQHGTSWKVARRERDRRELEHKAMLGALSERVRKILEDQDEAERVAARALSAAKREADTAEENRALRSCAAEVAQFCQEVGIEPPDSAHPWGVARELRLKLREERDSLRVASAVAALEEVADRIARALERVRPQPRAERAEVPA